MTKTVNANRIRVNAIFKTMDSIVLFTFSILNLILLSIKH